MKVKIEEVNTACGPPTIAPRAAVQMYQGDREDMVGYEEKGVVGNSQVSGDISDLAKS